MSVCTFIAANIPLPEHYPEHDYPRRINLNDSCIDDDGADDNFHLLPFDAMDEYTDLSFGVRLEWPQYTEGRGEQVAAYIRKLLQYTNRIELWRVWVPSDECPRILRRHLTIDALTPEDIRAVDDAEVWRKNSPEQMIYTCLTVCR